MHTAPHWPLLAFLLRMQINATIDAGADKIYDIVNDLNTELRIELNVFVQLGEGPLPQALLMEHKWPRLIVTKSVDEPQIYETFTGRCLTVAFIEPMTLEGTSVLLPRLLWQLHHTNVLFVVRIMSSQQILQLFSRCWHNGFVNVLLLFPNGSLQTYHPYPQLRVVTLYQLQQYHNKQHLLNFQGSAIRVQISENSPRSYRYVDRQGRSVNSGYFVKMLSTFSALHNATLCEVPMPTRAILISDTIAALMAHKIDVVANLLYTHVNYSRSVVLQNFRAFIMVPQSRPVSDHMYLVKPLGAALWTLLMFAVAYISLLMTAVYWLQQHVLDFSTSLLQTLNTMLFLPNSYRRISTRTQAFLFKLLLLSGFLLTNFYQSSLASMLITRIYERQINTLAELSRTQLLLHQTEMDTAYMREVSEIPPVVWQRIRIANIEEVTSLRRDLNTSCLHSGIEDKVDFFMYQQKFLPVPLFRKIDDVLFRVPLFVPIRHNCAFLPLLNRFLRRITDHGLYQKFMGDIEEDGILSGEIRFFQSKHVRYHPLSLDHFRLMFELWFVGLLLAAISFFYEIVKYKCYPN